MEKMFEDYFSEIQADMVSICLEYVEKRAEKIYIYCSFENGMISSGFFYKVNSKIVKKNKLNDVIVDGQKKYDVSIPRQKGAINIINDDIKALKRLCQEYQKEMPTQTSISVAKPKLIPLDTTSSIPLDISSLLCPSINGPDRKSVV